MSVLALTYRMVVGTVRVASPLLSLGGSKVARGLAGHRRAHEVLAAWGRNLRDPARPVVWFHAPSVGEGLQARAVIDAMRELRPDMQVVYTFFSPSAEDLARSMGADIATYLPWDLKGPASAALDAVRPGLLVFTKTEVWPVLADEARRRGVPVAIVGASVPEGAGRTRWPARSLLRPTWRSLAVACANSEADAGRLTGLGVERSRVHNVGDPGIDSAAQRVGVADPAAAYLAPFLADARPTLVAGSTWPADEAVLVPALHEVRRRVPDVRAIIAPHEPDERHVLPLMESLASGGWTSATLSDVEAAGSASGVDAVVVDRVGVLAHLYTVGAVAFVGGGYHDAGLHSVLEPAAARVPIAFGPRHHNARAAGDLLAEGGARIAKDSGSLAEIVTGWLTDDARREHAARQAFAYIDAHRGASARSARLLEALITPSQA